MKQWRKKLRLTTSWFGSLLLIFIFSANVLAGGTLIRIGQAWCQCAFQPTEVCVMDNRVLYVDKALHQIYTFTHTGTFNGNLARDGDCVGPEDFSPFRIAYIDNLVFATCHHDNAVKSLRNGKVTGMVTASDLGFTGSKPTAINAGDYFIYAAFDNDKLVAMYYDFEVEKTIDTNCVAVDFKDENLIVLTQDSILKTYDVDLNFISQIDISGHYTGQIQNPTDMVIEDDGTIWITHDCGLTVFYEDGTYGIWGNKYTDMELERTIISGDPIVGSKGIFPANAIDVASQNFFMTQNGKYGLTASKDLINTVSDSQVHFLAIALTKDDYWDHAVNIWKLQQTLYPQVLVAVFQDSGADKINIQKNGIYLDGEFITDNFSELESPSQLSDEILACRNQTENLIIKIQGKEIKTDISELSRPFKTSLVLLEIHGEKTPLLVDNVDIINPNRFQIIETQYELPEYPSILYALILDENGKCHGARVIR